MKTMRPPLPVVRTQGCRIVLADGRELIDGIASWWTACHGYNHPHIRQAVERQLAAMPHVMFGGLVHEQALTLARRLAALLPGDLDRVFFCEFRLGRGRDRDEDGGAVLAQPRRARRAPSSSRSSGGYHGDTTGAMAVSDPDAGMHDVFRGAAAGAFHRRSAARTRPARRRFERFLQRHGDEIAGIIVEPLVQGAGGMRFHDARRAAAAARRWPTVTALLLIFDEIFTGFGRTGTMFACEAAGVVPDIVTLSKALTGGTLPLAATVARKHVFEAFWSDDPKHALMHGPTYMAQCAGLRRRQRLARSVRARAAAGAGARRSREQMARELAPCRGLHGRQGRAGEGRDRRGRDGADRRPRCAARALRGGGRVHPPVRQRRSI